MWSLTPHPWRPLTTALHTDPRTQVICLYRQCALPLQVNHLSDNRAQAHTSDSHFASFLTHHVSAEKSWQLGKTFQGTLKWDTEVLCLSPAEASQKWGAQDRFQTDLWEQGPAQGCGHSSLTIPPMCGFKGHFISWELAFAPFPPFQGSFAVR